jgi:hypothetical protein
MWWYSYLEAPYRNCEDADSILAKDDLVLHFSPPLLVKYKIVYYSIDCINLSYSKIKAIYEV